MYIKISHSAIKGTVIVILSEEFCVQFDIKMVLRKLFDAICSPLYKDVNLSVNLTNKVLYIKHIIYFIDVVLYYKCRYILQYGKLKYESRNFSLKLEKNILCK